MKKKYKIALCVIGALIYLVFVLLVSNIIMFRIADKEYCSKLPVHLFYQNGYCLKLYMEEN